MKELKKIMIPGIAVYRVIKTVKGEIKLQKRDNSFSSGKCYSTMLAGWKNENE